MRYVAIQSEGSLIPYDLLDKVAAEELTGQKPGDFGLPKGRRLVDEISRVWADAQNLWANFKRRRQSLTDRDPYGTSITRSWIVSLLSDPEMLGFDLKLQNSAVVVNNSSFAISHRNGDGDDAIPVHIEGCEIKLDRRSNTKLRTSPQAMLQDFLNNSEHVLWGMVTNGVNVRLLRDSSRTSRPTYLEFDLESILEGNRFNEFALFYRLCHRTRFPQPGREPSECLLEKYYQDSIEQGLRVRDKLRDGVEETLKILGTAFLQHPSNTKLQEDCATGKLKAESFHRQLLLLVYRLLFLMVAEERGLIVALGENAEHNQKIYGEWYSVTHLRERAARIVEASPFSDLWLGLKRSFSLFEFGTDTNPLGIPPLNGDLFDEIRAIPDLAQAELYNHEVLLAFRHLSLFKTGSAYQRVNYSALDVEELGSVYESLLDFKPVIQSGDKGLTFDLRIGTERKSTGSYYTRPELVHELVESALVPVMEDRIGAAQKASAGKNIEDEGRAKEQAILNISICDPACGSGHFLLAAARRLGKELARIRTHEDEPRPEDFHLAVRDVISHCIYGVDLNPLAVDLCKLALWLEGHWAGKPLSFLDHRIRCGNSLIGVLDPGVLEKGIPDEAFTAVTGDDKKVASAFKKRNRKEREGQRGFAFETEEHLRAFAKASGDAMDFAEDTPRDVRRKGDLYRKAREQKEWLHDWTAANLWTAAFFVPLTKYDDPVVPTYETFMDYLVHGKDRPQMTGYANAMLFEERYFHWRLEFPEVFEKHGFDVVLGNPPWERIKLQEEEYWADDPHVATASNKAERTRRIEEYRLCNDPITLARIKHFDESKHAAEAASRFLRESCRFPLTAVGDINTYALFAELARNLVNGLGRTGIIVPTGIATDDTYKQFFATLNQNRALASLYDFENREAIFHGVHRSYKFSLLTITARSAPVTIFACFLARTEQMRDPMRRFELTAEDFALLNPNTRTCPIFRTRADAELTKKIYRLVPVLVNKAKGQNPWGIEFLAMFHLSNDSNLFQTSPGDELLPLYEAKMIQAYDHRAASVIYVPGNAVRQNQPVSTTPEQHADPSYLPRPLWWVAKHEVEARLGNWPRNWLIAFKDVTAATNERTAIFAVLPRIGVGNSAPILLLGNHEPKVVACLLANLNSLVFDMAARQKIGGLHMNFFLVEQLPALAPDSYTERDLDFIAPRVLELVYVSCDLKPFAEDMGYRNDPFEWDEDRRAILRAELDAYYALLYGLTLDELRYILDPKEIYGEDFPSETFRGLKENEIKKFGEYRTSRLVLTAYDELGKSDRFAGQKRESAIEAPKGHLTVTVG